MRYIAAYKLLVLGGNDAPNAGQIKAVLEAAGVEVRHDDLFDLVKALTVPCRR